MVVEAQPHCRPLPERGSRTATAQSCWKLLPTLGLEFGGQGQPPADELAEVDLDAIVLERLLLVVLVVGVRLAFPLWLHIPIDSGGRGPRIT